MKRVLLGLLGKFIEPIRTLFNTFNSSFYPVTGQYQKDSDLQKIINALAAVNYILDLLKDWDFEHVITRI